MANYRCTNCNQITEDHIAAVDGCMYCGAGYGGGRPPQKSIHYGVDLVKLAYAQRLALVLAASTVLLPAAVALSVLPSPAGPVASMWSLVLLWIYALVAIAAAALIVWRGRVMDAGLVATLFEALVAMLPAFGTIAMLATFARIHAFFRDTPVMLRWYGADIESARRAQNPSLCPGCGYDLTGNVSGICPECGRTV